MRLTDVHAMTTNDFSEWMLTTANQGRLLELVHGEVVEKMPSEAHGKLAALIAHFLLAFILPRRIQAHVGVEVRHEAPDDPYNSRLLDVSLRMTEAPPVASGAVSQMPDLAVEIQSVTDRPHHLREKALYYLQKGARVVWLVYPSAHQVEVCTLDAHGSLTLHTASAGDQISAGELLPGFELNLNDLFRDLPKP
jgi:Uma2 family endonuclease